jgi:hypothetical protein
MKNYIIIIIVSFIFNTNNLNSQEPEEKNKVEKKDSLKFSQ